LTSCIDAANFFLAERFASSN